jgi:outer membrane lipopolysaccharide assembly protein LptE/RlpB
MLVSLSACGFALREPVSFHLKVFISACLMVPLGGELKRQIRANGQTQITAERKMRK